MKTYTLLLDKNESAPSGIARLAHWAKATNEITGLIRGFLADGQLVDAEARYFREWVRRNPDILNDPLARALAVRVQRVYADNHATPEELDELRTLFTSFAGDLSNDASPATLPLTQPAPEVDFPERWFCFTGTFVSGKRDWCVEQVSQRGGRVADTVVANLDYLVIGSKVSAGWANQTYGRKIEAALNLRLTEAPVAIITEAHWLKYVNGFVDPSAFVSGLMEQIKAGVLAGESGSPTPPSAHISENFCR